MKKSIVYLSFFFIAPLLLASHEASAQSVTTARTARPTSEQSLQELVNEVRQLRVTLQRMKVDAYRGQVMVERLKLQQEYVARLSRDLSEVQDKIAETRAERLKLKEGIERTEKQVEAGLKDGEYLKAMRGELEVVTQLEQRLVEKDARLSGELEVERVKLAELNQRLNELEREILVR